MNLRSAIRAAWALTALGAQLACGAQTQDGSGSGSTTNFLERCTSDEACGEGLLCWCGVCTKVCDGNRDCRAHDDDAVCETPWTLAASCESPGDLCQLPPETEVEPTSQDDETTTVAVATGTSDDVGTSFDVGAVVNPEPDVTITPTPIPPLDCTRPEVLLDNGQGEPREAYTWNGEKCVRFIDTTNSARYLTEAQCEVGYIACNEEIPEREDQSLGSFGYYSSYVVMFSPRLADPDNMYREWTEANWLGWEGAEVASGDCPESPKLEFCLTTRTLTLQTADEMVGLSVTHPWRKPIGDYLESQRVKFRHHVWSGLYAVEVVDAEDESPIFLVLHGASDQSAWRLGNFQAHTGYPIECVDDNPGGACLGPTVWTSTMVSFYFDDGQSEVKRAFPTLDEVELRPFESTELADPNTGHSFDISAGVRNTAVPTPAAPDCGKAAFHHELFVHRLK